MAPIDSAQPTEEQNQKDISKSDSKPVISTAAVGRFTARQPPSSISDVIHGAQSSSSGDRARSEFVESKTGKSGSNNTPVISTAAVGRFTARQPPASISDVIHGARPSSSGDRVCRDQKRL